MADGAGIGFVLEAGEGLGEGEGALVAVEAVSVADLLGFGFLGADNEHGGDFFELGVADLGPDFFGAGVERGAEAGGLEFLEDVGGVVGDLIGDGQHADLLGGEPEGEGAGEVLDEDAHETFHASRRGPGGS